MKKINLTLRFIAYEEKDGTFTSVCLDLDLVEEGHTSMQEAILSINEAAMTHLKAAGERGFPKELINRPAPNEYWEKLNEMSTPKIKPISSRPFKFYNVPEHVTI